MVERVAEHIHEHVPHLARRREVAAVVPVAPDPPAAREEPVDGARGADGQPAQRRRERAGVARLDDQVQVITLDREVHDAGVRVPRGGDGGDDEAAEVRRPQRGPTCRPAR
ncbi:MAG TPA: hypothetical protein VGQ83_29425 [Polyangia bacterium]